MPLHYSLDGKVRVPLRDYFAVWADSQPVWPHALLVLPSSEIVSQHTT